MVQSQSKQVVRPRRNRLLTLGGVILVVALFGFATGALRKRPHDSEAEDTPADSTTERAPAERPARSASLGAAPASDHDRAEREAANRREIRKVEVNRLFDRSRIGLLNGTQGLDPETMGNAMVPYIQGMLATLRETNPEALGDLRERMTEQVCNYPQTDGDLMLIANTVKLDSELGAPRMFDCAFKGRKSEDVVLWTMLDAWKAAGSPDVPGMADLKNQANDQRTTRRLSTGIVDTTRVEQMRASTVARTESAPAAQPARTGTR
jgi:hypothetical protein